MSKHVSFRERWERAKQDTSGFEKWGRNLVFSGLLALLVFIGQWWLLSDLGEAVEDLWLSLLILVVSFLLLPALEFVSQFVRAPIILLERKIDSLDLRVTEKERELASKDQQVTAAQWQELADRFKRMDLSLRADWTHSSMNGKETWRICGGFQIKECQALCKLAGAMLTRSPKTVAHLPQDVRSHDDEIERWLHLLKQNGELATMNYALEVGQNDEKLGVLVMGSIYSLPEVSSRACIECAAREV